MRRGGVIIGVNKYEAGHLPQLQAAVEGARRVAEWAQSNGFEVKLMTDDRGPITLRAVKDALIEFVQRRGDQRLDQLLLYFAGHGINKAYSEHWLLSEAPVDPNEAISLRSSMDVARYTTAIPHIVFVSDACRTAADTIQAQNVEGGIVFPNVDRAVPPATLDRFYAAMPGHPAQEVTVVGETAGVYNAIYTDCMLYALQGKVASLIERLDENGVAIGIVTPRSLGDFLEAEVPKRVAKLRLKKAQDPDSQVESVFPTYLARLPLPITTASRGGPPPPLKATTRASIAQMQTAAALEVTPSRKVGAVPVPGTIKEWTHQFNADMAIVSNAVGRGHFETQCGFTVLGANVRHVECRGARCEPFPGGAGTVHIRLRDDGARGIEVSKSRSVLIEFENGNGCVLAALPGYIGTLVIDRDELADVTYEPSQNSWRWNEYRHHANHLRRLRAIVAASTRHGVFRVDRTNAKAIGDGIRFLKGIDPTLGIYAAYAYNDAGLLDSVRSVANYMRHDLHSLPFDVAMLQIRPSPTTTELKSTAVVPFCPMLSQGWSLLPAKGVKLPEAVTRAGRHLAPSLWTLFQPEGVHLLLTAIQSGEVR